MIDSIREFNEKKVAPLVPEIEKDHFPRELLDEMSELGLFGLSIPEEWEGSGESMVMQCAVIEELAKECFTVSWIASATLVQKAIIYMGADEQKAKLLPPLLNHPVAFAVTEPGAGTDVSAMTTSAVKDGDEWVINGQKTFISFVDQADYVAVFAKTHETGDGGISMFLVPKDTPGFKVGSVFEKIGAHGSGTAELFLEDVRVPAMNLIGRENKGMRIALSLLDEARVTVAAGAVGICERAIEVSAGYIKQRVAFGKPLATKQGLQWYLAEMKARTDAAKALVMQAARNFDEGDPVALDAASAKLIATRTALFVVDKAVELCGGMGLVKDFGLERLYRDAKVLTIVEGTDEVMKMVISRFVID
jgi:alkylation response protein AidB-like acyl-CoA dehydrogenase